MTKPLKNEILELGINDISFEGKGIAKIDGGFVVFVDGAVTGDIAKVKINKTKKNYAEARLIELLDKSEFRTVPKCSHFGICNGCKLQHISYEHQCRIKRQNVINSLERIGGFKDINVPEVLDTQATYFYRNKIEFSFSRNRWLTEKELDADQKDKSFALGFHKPGFIDKVVDIESCELQSEISNTILNLTRNFFKSKDTSIYSTRTESGYLRYLIIRQSANINDLMINLITSSENAQLIEEYSELIQKEIPQVTTLVNGISRSKAQVAESKYYNVIFGNGYIEEVLNKYKFRIEPDTFFQTNSKQAQRLFEKVIEIASFNGEENVLDLYCGCGAISIFISEYVNKIMGVDLSKESILTANENAQLNNISNCDFISYDAKDYLSIIVNEPSDKYDTIILDPPRSGIHPKAAEYLLRYKPSKIIYVSCNPATQARDLKLLSEFYTITKVQPVDMFPNTFHIENIARLDLKK